MSDRREYHRVWRAKNRPGMRLDATAVRQHVEDLSRLGVGYKKVAAAAEVSTHTLRCILDGSTKTVMPATAERLLAVTVQSALGDESRVDSSPARAAMRELLELGYPSSWVAHALGYQGSGVQFLRHELVRKRNADALINLRVRIGELPYEYLADQTVRDQGRDERVLAQMLEEGRRRMLDAPIHEQLRSGSPEDFIQWRAAGGGR